MKSILSTNPTFTPGAANVGTLNFSSVSGFNIAGLLAVLNQTRGVLLYATGKQPTGYFSWNSGTKVMTLKVDTSTHSSGDQLQVIYDGPGSNGPVLNTLISGGVTDSIITASPAILLAVTPSGIQASAENWDYLYYVKNGSTTLLEGRSTISSGFATNHPVIPSSGIDCPNGIKVTVSSTPSANAQTLANARLTINYILK
jgi:hypothetical protein